MENLKQINCCVKCNHTWKQRVRRPKKCPRCNNPNWNKQSERDLIRLIIGK